MFTSACLLGDLFPPEWPSAGRRLAQGPPSGARCKPNPSACDMLCCWLLRAMSCVSSLPGPHTCQPCQPPQPHPLPPLAAHTCSPQVPRSTGQGHRGPGRCLPGAAGCRGDDGEPAVPRGGCATHRARGGAGRRDGALPGGAPAGGAAIGGRGGCCLCGWWVDRAGAGVVVWLLLVWWVAGDMRRQEVPCRGGCALWSLLLLGGGSYGCLTAFVLGWWRRWRVPCQHGCPAATSSS